MNAGLTEHVRRREHDAENDRAAAAGKAAGNRHCRSSSIGRPPLVTHIEFAKMIDATRPWMDYGLDVAHRQDQAVKAKKDDDSDDDETSRSRRPSHRRRCCNWASSCHRCTNS